MKKNGNWPNNGPNAAQNLRANQNKKNRLENGLNTADAGRARPPRGTTHMNC
jgi:hypothetical protein